MSRNEVRIIGGMWRGRKLKVPANAAARPSLGRARETLFNWLAGGVEGSHCLDLFAGSGALGFEALSRGAPSLVLVDNHRSAADVLLENARRLGAENCTVRRQSALAFLKHAAEREETPLAERAFSGEREGVHLAERALSREREGVHLAERALSGEREGVPLAERVDGCGPAPAAVRETGTPAVQWDIVFLDPPFASGLLPAALAALRACNSLRPGARIYFETQRRAEFHPEGFRILKQATAGDTRFGLLASP